ncbi:MAG TPA: polysaccharide deacetylase family protein [Gemmatimonadales bacterium]|nr:polysaccharide deacetylase family protein [Gemmatimonadales bacterium]
MRTALRQVKRGGLTALKAAGAFGLVRESRWRDNRLLILCYHGVSLLDEHKQDPTLYVRPSLLAARLSWLRRDGYTVVSLGEGLERLAAGTLPQRSVCLTFDDGMYNFGAAALPVLEQFRYPATVYLATYHVVHDEPVFHPLCSYLLRRARGRVVDARASLGMDEVWDLRTYDGLLRAFHSVQRAVERLSLGCAEKTAFAGRIAAQLGVDFEPLMTLRMFHLLRPDEVTGLARRGVAFELHTHRHRVPLDRDLFLRELRDNRSHLVDMVGYAPSHFCYPSGYWRPEFLPWLQEAGVRSATTGEPGIAARSSDPLLLPRVLDSECITPIEFEGWLTGLPFRFQRAHRNGHQNGNGAS